MSKLTSINLTKEIVLSNLKPKPKVKKEERRFEQTEQKILDDESEIQVNSEDEESAPQDQPFTKEDYKNMLKDFEEIEDMMCSICMDSMSVGETIVKTKCGIENLFPSN